MASLIPKIYVSSIESTVNPWERYSLKEVLQATDNFNEDNMIGEGGFGCVYYGRTSQGVEIAVKRLKSMTDKAELEFAVEVEMLARVRHKNLLSLRGFYAGGLERLIVYDYMPNHSVHEHLYGGAHLSSYGAGATDTTTLPWPIRMRIAVGSAEGLAYLHHEVRPHIIHRDVKASNVLLDTSFTPRVADFGFAKLVPEGASHMTTRVKGTLGYLAPEYAMWGKVSDRCDVFSFGVLLLALASGRKPIEKVRSTGAKLEIREWVAPLVETGRMEDVADPRMEGVYDDEELRRVVTVGMLCTDAKPGNRPSMRKVVEMLKVGVAADHDLEKRLTTVRTKARAAVALNLDEPEDGEVDSARKQGRGGKIGEEVKLWSSRDPVLYIRTEKN